MTVGKMTQSVMSQPNETAYRIMAVSIMTLGRMTLSIRLKLRPRGIVRELQHSSK